MAGPSSLRSMKGCSGGDVTAELAEAELISVYGDGWLAAR